MYLISSFIRKSLHHIEEQQLVSRLRDRDRTALEYLYDHYSGALYGVVSRMIRHREIAEEVLQDAFIKIWSRIEAFDPEKGRLFTWMLNITRNLAIDKMRSREISKEIKTGGIDNLVSSIEKSSPVEMNIEGIGIKEALNTLSEDLRFVVENLYFGGFSQSELSEASGIPLGTIKTRLRMAMNQLRVKFGIE